MGIPGSLRTTLLRSGGDGESDQRATAGIVQRSDEYGSDAVESTADVFFHFCLYIAGGTSAIGTEGCPDGPRPVRNDPVAFASDRRLDPDICTQSIDFLDLRFSRHRPFSPALEGIALLKRSDEKQLHKVTSSQI